MKRAVTEIIHHLRFYRVSLALNLSREMQYRLDFWVGFASTAGWSIVALVFLKAIYGQVPRIAGYNFPEILLFLGFYRFIEGLGEFIFYRSFKRLASDIRRGHFDILMSKPLDLQFFLSTRFSGYHSLGSSLIGLAIFAYGFSQGGSPLGPAQLFLFLLLALTGFIFYYAFWFSISLLNFWFVKVDNLRHLVHGFFSTTRYPPEAYGKKVEIFLSFVVPLALIVAFPVKTFLQKGEWWHLPFSFVVALLFLFLGRVFFRFALRSYQSAGG